MKHEDIDGGIGRERATSARIAANSSPAARCRPERKNANLRSGLTPHPAVVPFYTLEEMAELVKLSETTLHRMVRQREVPHLRIGARVIRFVAADVQRWMRDKYTVSPPEFQIRHPEIQVL